MDTGGPFQELYNQPSIVTKRPRIKSAEKLIGFKLFEDDWPTTPPTGFTITIFLALLQNKMLINPIKYEYFSDLEFNHEKSHKLSS
ncbi:hypothetical protein MASR2M39_25700 [Ignavibacteriales bacterium]